MTWVESSTREGFRHAVGWLLSEAGWNEVPTMITLE